MNTPGIRPSWLKLLGDHNINYTFYEDVCVPATGASRRGEPGLEP